MDDVGQYAALPGVAFEKCHRHTGNVATPKKTLHIPWSNQTSCNQSSLEEGVWSVRSKIWESWFTKHGSRELPPPEQRPKREALLKLLQKHESLFEGKLGQWDGEFVHFELKPNAKPFCANPFPVPLIHRDTIKRELKRLYELGVIEEIEGSKWAAPSFLTVQDS